MIGYQQEQRSLTKEQKEAVGLLSIGTFLEYFDLMLFVHMGVIINELFFPKTDPFTASLLTALSFCSLYVLRPFGAMIFGYIGDNLGRKKTIVITTTMMSFSCIVMATLPTYNQIGITASCIMVICRIVQGLSSLGEVTGAELYVTEMVKPPMQYVAVGIVSVCTLTGGLFALGFAWFCTAFFLDWRIAFWIGAIIALVGASARTRLREAPDFADAKRRIQNAIKVMVQDPKILEHSPAYKEKVSYKTSLSYLCILSMWPALFFLIYIYCGNIFKAKFGYTGEQVIQNNFFVALFNWVVVVSLILLTMKVHPLKILKVRVIIFLISIPICLYFLSNVSTPQELFLLQLLFISTSVCLDPAASVLYKHFPIFKRFTYSSFLHAISKILVYVTTSLGMVYVTKAFEYYGILMIMLPLGLLFYYSICYFEKLEKVNGHYSKKELFGSVQKTV
ncbi:MFS transporter [Candidatus Tisiphia endosymbiont of Nedyus quadrimaculatus]|uniref:MFS transporter n=1 Tax=Candidatus Tisiphia endosymbiont of Nedyus quadrimaculatus TaxID=3139332 RepID=UPI00345E72C7